MFRTVFRLLAAKVLQDRGHELAGRWNPADIDTVLKGISGYYKLPRLPGEIVLSKAPFSNRHGFVLGTVLTSETFLQMILAFVYENTLITEETREHFGTHSTPRPMAEYIVNRLELWRTIFKTENL